MGSGAHAALFLVADYRAWSLPGLERVLAHRYSVVVHLNWVSIFLGFHAFGMYIHNDTLLALGRQSDQFGDTGIPFRPVIGLLGQALLGSEASVNGTTAYTGIRLTGRADLLVHHITAGSIPQGCLLQFHALPQNLPVYGPTFPTFVRFQPDFGSILAPMANCESPKCRFVQFACFKLYTGVHSRPSMGYEPSDPFKRALGMVPWQSLA